MRSIPILASLSFIALAACASPHTGYYDSNGNWVAPPNATTHAQRHRAPDPGRSTRYDHDDYRPRIIKYDRPGYYDYQGYYITPDDRMAVPEDMLPPRGMCRVWLPNRAPDRQPHIESCDGIHDRVPAGAYVIYGG